MISRKARTCFVERTRCVSGSASPTDARGLSRDDGGIGAYVAAILQKGQVGDGWGGIVSIDITAGRYMASLKKHL
jgi:hypothetical protein